MFRVFLFLVLAFSLSGCIKLQMPDDMVSDTVDVIRGSDDEPEDIQIDSKALVAHSVVGISDTPVADLTQRCLAELESRTVEMLGRSDLTLTVVSQNVAVVDDKAIASCTMSIG